MPAITDASAPLARGSVIFQFSGTRADIVVMARCNDNEMDATAIAVAEPWLAIDEPPKEQ